MGGDFTAHGTAKRSRLQLLKNYPLGDCPYPLREMPLINRHKGCCMIPSFPELPAAGPDMAGLIKREEAAVIVCALLGGGGEMSLSTPMIA